MKNLQGGKVGVGEPGLKSSATQNTAALETMPTSGMGFGKLETWNSNTS